MECLAEFLGPYARDEEVLQYVLQHAHMNTEMRHFVNRTPSQQASDARWTPNECPLPSHTRHMLNSPNLPPYEVVMACATSYLNDTRRFIGGSHVLCVEKNLAHIANPDGKPMATLCIRPLYVPVHDPQSNTLLMPPYDAHLVASEAGVAPRIMFSQTCVLTDAQGRTHMLSVACCEYTTAYPRMCTVRDMSALSYVYLVCSIFRISMVGASSVCWRSGSSSHHNHLMRLGFGQRAYNAQSCFDELSRNAQVLHQVLMVNRGGSGAAYAMCMLAERMMGVFQNNNKSATETLPQDPYLLGITSVIRSICKLGRSQGNRNFLAECAGSVSCIMSKWLKRVAESSASSSSSSSSSSSRSSSSNVSRRSHKKKKTSSSTSTTGGGGGKKTGSKDGARMYLHRDELHHIMNVLHNDKHSGLKGSIPRNRNAMIDKLNMWGIESSSADDQSQQASNASSQINIHVLTKMASTLGLMDNMHAHTRPTKQQLYQMLRSEVVKSRGIGAIK